MPQKCLPLTTLALLATAVKNHCICHRGSRNEHIHWAQWLQLTVRAQKQLFEGVGSLDICFYPLLLHLPQRVGNKCWQSLKTAATTAKGIMVKFDIAVRQLHHWWWLWVEAPLTPILAQADRSRQKFRGNTLEVAFLISYMLDHMVERHLRCILFSVFTKNFVKKTLQNHHLYFSIVQFPSCDTSYFLSELWSVTTHLLFCYATPPYHQKV